MGACASTLQSETNPQYKYTLHESPPNTEQKIIEEESSDNKNEHDTNTSHIQHTHSHNALLHPVLSTVNLNTVEYIPTESKLPGRKVCIIGAGPSGIHMASLLIKMGYKSDQIILLEKTNRCCGKSMTIPDEYNCKYTIEEQPNPIGSSNHYCGYDIIHEMGTCYLHPEYHIISSLLHEYDATNIEIPFCAGDVFGTDLNKEIEQKDASSAFNRLKFSDWVLQQIKGKVEEKGVFGLPNKYLAKIPHFIAGGAAFEIAVQQYSKVWEDICGKRKQTVDKVRAFPEKPKPENLKRLNCTFFEFLVNNKLEALIPALIYSQSMQGYGILDRIPAFYGLLWTTPELMRTTADIFRVVKDASNVIVLSKGYEHLWSQMVLKHKLNIIYNANIINIDRDLENNNNKIKQQNIEIKYIKNEEEYLIEADILFIACGCKKALEFLTDATEEEKEIFGSIKPSTLCATLFEYDVNPNNSTHRAGGNLFPHEIWKGNDSIYAYRNSLKSLIGVDEYNKWIKHKQLTKDRAICYQYHTEQPDEKIDGEKLSKYLIKQLNEMSETNVKIIQQKVWDYFPKWSCKDIVENEYPWKVKDELQGKYNKCFYIGSSVCMESVLNVCEYNVELTSKYYFELNSDVFHCKKRMNNDGQPFGDYVPFVGIEKLKHICVNFSIYMHPLMYGVCKVLPLVINVQLFCFNEVG
eukprot:113785_1